MSWLASILAFLCGVLATLVLLVYCSDDGLKRFIDTLYRVRKGDKKNE